MKRTLKFFLPLLILLKMSGTEKNVKAAACFFENLYEKIKFAVLTFQKELKSYEHEN